MSTVFLGFRVQGYLVQAFFERHTRGGAVRALPTWCDILLVLQGPIVGLAELPGGVALSVLSLP